MTDATRAAKELAKEHDIDLEEVTGSGEEGRILKSDVEALVEEAEEAEEEETPEEQEPEEPEDEEEVDEEEAEPEESEDEEDEGPPDAEREHPEPMSHWKRKGADRAEPAYLVEGTFTNRGGKSMVQLRKAPGRIPDSHNKGPDRHQVPLHKFLDQWEMID